VTDTALMAVGLAALAGFFAGRAYRTTSARDRAFGADGLSERFLQGLEYLSEGRRDEAIAELSQVPRDQPGGEVVEQVLGSLLRETGQVERAIQIHQGLARRQAMPTLARARAHAALGEDYRRAGLLDRAERAFEQALEADDRNVAALLGLQRIREDQGRWEDALALRTRLSRRRHGDDSVVLAHLHAQVGRERLRLGDPDGALTAFREALAHDRRALPAHLGLAEVLERQDPALAAATLEEAARAVPERAYLLFEPHARACAAAGEPGRHTALLENAIEKSPRDWRARLALARVLRARGDAHEALGLLRRAGDENPQALLVHLETWHTLLALGLPREATERYLDAATGSILFAAPHVCRRCRYRAADVQWRCPQCHEWDTFVEERLAPPR
jgi:lipopolysaccharide biosynthesis regulator YciM